jgi:hypothetical protein
VPRQPERFAADYILPRGTIQSAVDGDAMLAEVTGMLNRRIGALVGEYVISHGASIVSAITTRSTDADFLDNTVRLVMEGRIMPLADATNQQVEDFRTGTQRLSLAQPGDHEDGTYGFIGGPANGRSIRTNGVRIYRVPTVQPVSYAGYDLTAPVLASAQYVEYERGIDNVYRVYRV